MITFGLSGEQEAAQSSFHTAARGMLRPAARGADNKGAIAPDLLARIWDLGLVHAQSEDSRDHVLNSIVLEELGWGDATLSLGVAGTMAFVQAVATFGTPKQKAEILPIVTGEAPAVAAVAITEPSFDFDVTNLQTTASRSPSGYRVNGLKAYVPLAQDCEFFLVIANMEGADDAFLVPRDSAGIIVESQAVMGLRALQFGKVRFDNVEIPSDMRLGGDNGCNVQWIVDCSRAGKSSILTGLSRAVYEYVKDYTRERIAHGSALAQKQTVGFRIVDMHIAIESMRWMNWKAASELQAHSPTATRSASLAHLYACEQATWITDEGVQLLGGHGYLKDHPVELWYRDARTLTVLEGLASV